MIGTDEIQNLLTSGGTVVGTDGDKIGKVSQVFLDDATGSPEWVTVTTGLFGTGESFIPLNQASVRGDEIVVPYDKSTVKGAPRIDDANGHLSESEEAELYRYYGLDYSTGYDTTSAGVGTPGTTGAAGFDDAATTNYDVTDTAGLDSTTTTGVAGTTDVNAHGTVGHDTSGPTTDNAMTRSEEQLHVGTERVQTGRARLRKYVVTEQQTVSVTS
jgi:sporulation protein YlmC with PRC-barrel domain/stress response protein YsnF